MKTIYRKSHRKLISRLIKKRKASGLRQAQVAEKLGHTQSWLAKIESGQRRVDVFELIDLANVIGFAPGRMVAKIMPIVKKERKRELGRGGSFTGAK